MLIRFNTSNFKSINNEVSLNLTPSAKVRRHAHHTSKHIKLPVLRGALIYGANASGKSNLCEAMDIVPLLLQEDKANIIPFDSSKPSVFEYEFIINDVAYAFGFSYKSGAISEEWLYTLNDEGDDDFIYRYGSDTAGKIEINESISGKLDEESNLYLKFLFRSRDEQRLFISELVRKKDEHLNELLHPLKEAMKWFLNVFTVISPHSSYIQFEDDLIDDENSKKFYETFLKAFDTGIESIEISQHELSDLEDSIGNRIKKILDDNKETIGHKWGFVVNLPTHRLNIDVDENGNIEKINEVLFKNSGKSSGKSFFSFNELSDGTQRLIDLIPAIYKSIFHEKVFVIDEIDRSIHPIIIKILLEFFYDSKVKPNGQIIVTTHDTGVMEQEFLRKDEIWFVQKEHDGSSLLYALDEYALDVRNDKCLIKDYLNGRYGAVVNYKIAKSIIAELYDGKS
ncbi:ATP/GTP-binding protein [Aeromonas caviae]|uniref:AAA family ATPase n=1 Tax=Aeromonas caviae TaxID=648 RepID=UPI0038D1AF65